jgi:lipoprotein-anchoring transpeptidase ErfK/SrfK
MINQSQKHVHAPSGLSLRVNVSRQTLDVLRDGHVQKSYSVSTSGFGLGTEPGSLKTPLGCFSIAEKVGHNALPGTVFKGRQPTGEIAPQGGDDDLILTRILWLEGLDQTNANTRERYIYIHGTNQEHLLGTPASHGCVRLSSTDIIELFQEIPEGTLVEITP